MAALPPAAVVWPHGTGGQTGALVVVVAIVLCELLLGSAWPAWRRAAAALVLLLVAELITLQWIGRAPLVIAGATMVVTHSALVAWRPANGAYSGRGTPVATPAVVFAGLAALCWYRTAAPVPFSMLLLVAMIFTEAQHRRPGFGQAWVRATHDAARAVVTAVVSAIVLLVAFPVIYLPGAVVSALRRLRPERKASSWSPTGSMAQRRRDARRPFAAPPVSVSRRRHLAGVAVVTVVAVTAYGVNRTVLAERRQAAVRTPLALEPPKVPGSEPVPQNRSLADRFDNVPYSERPALRGQSFVDELQRETLAVRLVAHPTLGYQLGDHSGVYVNVVDGSRRTALSTCEGCPRVRLLLAGGSLVFGVGQRDGWTIASELVTLAALDGIDLDLINLGVPGWTLDQEAADLRTVASGKVREADVVAFLDGFNDGAATLVDALGGASLDEPARLDLDRAELLLSWKLAVGRSDAERIGREAAERYMAIAGPLDAELESSGAAVVRFFQPDASSAPLQRRTVESMAVLPDGFYDQFRFDIVLATMAGALTPAIVDLRDAFDDSAQPQFIDTSHVSEEGATLLARAMYPHLRRLLLDRAI